MKKKLFSVLIIGTIWGIFEATAGYLLHLLPISIGFLVWYPVAFFFLMAAHRATGKKSAVLAVAALAAGIKLLNLMLPGRIDRVINPAVSILFEGAAVFMAAFMFERGKGAKKAGGLLLVSLGANTLWRALYLGYLALMVPDWIRAASVLKTSADLIRFIAIDNALSSLVVFAGMLLVRGLKGKSFAEPRRFKRLSAFARALLSVGLLSANIALQMVLW